MNRRNFIKLSLATTACAVVSLTGASSQGADSAATPSGQPTRQTIVEKDGWIVGSDDKCRLQEQQVLELRAELEGIKNSRSWRLTEPIRRLKQVLQEFLSKR